MVNNIMRSIRNPVRTGLERGCYSRVLMLYQTMNEVLIGHGTLFGTNINVCTATHPLKVEGQA